MAKISGVIITFNEQNNIANSINSLKPVVDEIIVVDSFSTDKTPQIAQKLGAKVIKQKFLGYIEQKNFAMNLASYDYVLHLDADEMLSPKLQKKILQLKKNLYNFDAYKFKRKTLLINKFIHHGDWYPDWKIRLWNKNKGSWGGYNPHDKVIMNPKTKIKKVHADILHFSFRTWEEFFDQMHKFLKIKLSSLQKNKKKAPALAIIFGPVFTFFRCYILKLGFLDGLHGLIIAKTQAYMNMQKYFALWISQKSKSNKTPSKSNK